MHSTKRGEPFPQSSALRLCRPPLRFALSVPAFRFLFKGGETPPLAPCYPRLRQVAFGMYKHCPVHDPQAAAEAAAYPVPTMAPAPEIETEEEAAQREAEHEQRMAEYKAEQERKEEERKAEFERQQKKYEAEQGRRDKQRRARVATFEHIIEEAPASFNPAKMRIFLRLLIHLDYSFLEEVATHFANADENAQHSDDEIVLAALDGTADEKLTGLALRLVLSDHIGIPHEGQPDLLTEAEQVFAPKKPKVVKAKADSSNKPKPTAAKVAAKKETTRKKAA